MAGALAGDVKNAVNSLTRGYVPEAIRLFEENNEIRKAYNAMLKAKKAQKHEEVEEHKGRIKELMKKHGVEAKQMVKSVNLYEKLFSNLFADMAVIKKLLQSQVKLDYDLHRQKAPDGTVQEFLKEDSAAAKRFVRLMKNISDMSRSLALTNYEKE